MRILKDETYYVLTNYAETDFLGMFITKPERVMQIVGIDRIEAAMRFSTYSEASNYAFVNKLDHVKYPVQMHVRLETMD